MIHFVIGASSCDVCVLRVRCHHRDYGYYLANVCWLECVSHFPH
jgi:hypothetical protein